MIVVNKKRDGYYLENRNENNEIIKAIPLWDANALSVRGWLMAIGVEVGWESFDGSVQATEDHR